MSKQALQDSESEKSSPIRAQQYPRRSRVVLFTATAALLVIIALALGLGLGLGLKKHHHSAAAVPSSPSASPAPFSSLQPVQQSNFVLNGLQGQPAQDRVYNFTIAQVNGSPDGVSKPMLVVNGACVRVITTRVLPVSVSVCSNSHCVFRHVPWSHDRGEPGRQSYRERYKLY